MTVAAAAAMQQPRLIFQFSGALVESQNFDFWGSIILCCTTLASISYSEQVVNSGLVVLRIKSLDCLGIFKGCSVVVGYSMLDHGASGWVT